jgi:hypothetical protein
LLLLELLLLSQPLFLYERHQHGLLVQQLLTFQEPQLGGSQLTFMTCQTQHGSH